jgi:hypothetical protein
MKFSIRDLLLVTIIAALATGWTLDHFRPGIQYRRQAVRSAAMQHALDAEGFIVEQDGWRVRVYRESNPAKNDYEEDWSGF